ncbi:SRPBCC family protein [Amnibacterium kyonggiense]
MPSLTLEAATRIDAPPADVWRVLVDFAAYDRWNPTTRISGEPRVGSRLTVGAGPGLRFRARVLVADPGRELRWLGRLGLGGLADGEHWFRLDREADGTTALVHGERYSGLLVAFAGGRAEDASAYEAFNRALKDRVEALAAGPAVPPGRSA